nr:unnamed protein product [Spirometra erinaceieuropaei]
MEDFGKTAKGTPVKKITIRPKLPEKLASGSDGEVWSGVRAVFLNYGAVLHQLWIPGHTDTNGKKTTSLTLADVVLGYPDVSGYEINKPFHGAIVGRVAGRISNARLCIPYELDPSMNGFYRLTDNMKKLHCHHGGTFGLSKRTWEILELKSDSVKFKIFSPDGDEGFPGNLTVYVTYRITVNSEEKIELSIDYFACVADGITPLSLTNHTYYNLAGHLAGPEALDRHIACIAADRLLETEGDLIPTGRIQRVEDVDGADLRKPVSLKDGLQKIQPAPFQGYDEYYIFNQIPPDEAKVTVSEPNSGRRVEAFSDQLGVQFYTGNCLEPKTDPVGKNGYSYPQHSGFCIELHGFPDAVNKPNFPQCFIIPNGKPYTQKSKYTLVILLFLQRSRTREAKAQAQLAELSLVRSRLLAIAACDAQQARVQNTDHLQRILDMIHAQLYNGMMARITDNDAVSESFAATSGVKQGYLLALTLFSLMFSAILTDANSYER